MNAETPAAPLAKRPVRRLLKWIAWLGGLLFAYAAIGFLVVPAAAKWLLVNRLAPELGREIAVEAIEFNPFSLTAVAKNFAATEPGGQEPVARFSELFLDLEWQSLIERGLVLDAVQLIEPRLAIVRLQDNRYNFSDLIDKFLNRPASEPVRFSVANIEVLDGTIDFDDRPAGRRHALTDLRLALPFVSTLPVHATVRIQPAFDAKLNGARLAAGALARPFADTRDASLNIDLDALDLPAFVAYSPVPLKLKLASGKLTTRLKIEFVMPEGGKPTAVVSGTAALESVRITELDGAPVLEVPRLAIEIESLAVFARRLLLKSVDVEGVEATLVRGSEGTLRLRSLLPAAAEGESQSADRPAQPFEFRLAQASLRDGKITWRDQAVQPAFESAAERIQLTARNVSNAADQPMEIDLAFAASSGGEVKYAGKATMSPFTVGGSIDVQNLDIKRYAAYYGRMIEFQVEDGLLNASAEISLSLAGDEPQLTVTRATAALTRLRLRQPDQRDPFYSLERAALRDGELDLAARRASLGEIQVRGAGILVDREPDGTLNLQRLMPVTTAVAKAGEAAKPWSVSAKRVEVERAVVRFEDRGTAEPVKVLAEVQSATSENVSLERGAKTRLRLKASINRTGSLQLVGGGSLRPLDMSFDVDAKSIDVLPFQPYFADRVNISLLRGAVSAQGAVRLAGEEGLDDFGFRGDLGISDLESIDKANQAPFLRWRSLFLSNVKVSSRPASIDIGGAALSDFFSRMIVQADGKLNLQGIVQRGETAPDRPAEPSQAAGAASGSPGGVPSVDAFVVRIGGITLQGGQIDFSDYFIKPNYSADLTELSGRVGELSTQATGSAELELRGKVNKDAPVEIRGRLNPLAADPTLDIQANAKGIELSPLSPYSGKYAGYAIEKGKLSVDVAYRIENRKLEARNRIFLDQLTFGERVESPDATDLPVLLAVALLKNSRGEIDVNLPVSGSLDDPEFSVGGIVVQAILNLIGKIITAPFALLSSAFGGGEELSFIEFEPGRWTLTESARKRLDVLGKALVDRPALKLEVTGRFDPVADRDGLRRLSFERKVKSQKLNEAIKAGGTAIDVDAVVLSTEEYPKYLTLAYKQEKFPKPRNVIGLEKSLPPSEMEKLMLANIEASDAALLELATDRARAAKDHLTESGKVPPERIFLVASKPAAEEGKEQGSASRVDFSLR